MSDQHRRIRRHSFATFLLSTCCASIARADVVETTWLGGNGSWTDSTKWSGGVVPNNTATQSFAATIPGGSVSFSNGTVTLNSLNVLSGATLKSDRGQWFLSSSDQFDGTLLLTDVSSLTIPVNGTLSGIGTVSVDGSFFGPVTTTTVAGPVTAKRTGRSSIMAPSSAMEAHSATEHRPPTSIPVRSQTWERSS